MHKAALRLTAGFGALAAAGAMIAAASPAMASSLPWQLDPGDTLGPGQSITSQYDDWVLTMQTDGNLVEYGTGHIALASSNTAGNPGSVLFMQNDGNLVIRAPGNIPIWAAATDGNPGAVLQVQGDGGVVVYGPGHQVLDTVAPSMTSILPAAEAAQRDWVPTPWPGQPDGSATGSSSDGSGDENPDLSDTEPWVTGYDTWKEYAETSGDSIEMPGEVVPSELPLIDPIF
jgi:hypothetical protein